MAELFVVSSPAQFRTMFPDAEVSSDKLVRRTQDKLLCDPAGVGLHIIDARLSRKELLALGYWITHLSAFAPVAGVPAGDVWATLATATDRVLLSRMAELQVNSVAGVMAQFPEALISQDEFYLGDMAVLCCCYPADNDPFDTMLDGEFTTAQLLALMYWRTHLSEFPLDP